jgi:hypothetical protein
MLVKVSWEFDVENDTDTQEMLGLSDGDIEAIVADPERLELYNKDVATLFGVPQYVDLNLFFDDPTIISDDQIKDAMSDEYGWLVNSFKKVKD